MAFKGDGQLLHSIWFICKLSCTMQRSPNRVQGCNCATAAVGCWPACLPIAARVGRLLLHSMVSFLLALRHWMSVCEGCRDRRAYRFSSARALCQPCCQVQHLQSSPALGSAEKAAEGAAASPAWAVLAECGPQAAEGLA